MPSLSFSFRHSTLRIAQARGSGCSAKPSDGAYPSSPRSFHPALGFNGLALQDIYEATISAFLQSETRDETQTVAVGFISRSACCYPWINQTIALTSNESPLTTDSKN
ncbi:hypothetical protein C0Q70_02627 [Pomacea canaliculata]|uniref:Uncharacterized protein n=1 Tax=Pomacea canaliculata TaxID=400727 RepID=A0A2T7PQG6_POMCA|nr:hypothetical protein C0Q70_02627 [Pomacea canaliculata]